MQVRNVVLGSILSVATIGAAVGFAQRPVDNVNPGRHPNIAAAQRLVTQAAARISDAQRANEWDMNGHAQKAKELLDQANEELRQAATTANRR